MIRLTQSINYPKAFIKVRVNNEDRTVGIHKAIATSWFTTQELNAIRADAKRDGLAAAAERHDLHPKTVYYIVENDGGGKGPQ